MSKHSFKATFQHESSPTDFSGTVRVEKTHMVDVFTKNTSYNLLDFSNIQILNIYVHFL